MKLATYYVLYFGLVVLLYLSLYVRVNMCQTAKKTKKVVTLAGVGEGVGPIGRIFTSAHPVICNDISNIIAYMCELDLI